MEKEASGFQRIRLTRRITIVLLISFTVLTACLGREKLHKYDNKDKFNDNCVFDAADILDDTKLSACLEETFSKTGYQPYIVTFGYMSSVEDLNKAIEYAEAWTKNNLKDEFSIVLTYFMPPEGSPNLGYTVLSYGSAVDLDDEVMNDFGKDLVAEVNDNWVDTSLSDEEVILSAFSKSVDKYFK